MFKSVIIKKIEMVPSFVLHGMRLTGNDECILPSGCVLTKISTQELIEAKIESELENNIYMYTTTVEFDTCDKKLSGIRKYSFILTAADGTRYLVGTDSRPYPVVTIKNPYPAKPKESMLNHVTIKWRSVYPMLTALV